jgi:peptidoglycan/LPS O-acetylase OafA/YrhL
MWLGAAIAVVAGLMLTPLAAALASNLNGPGSRVVAPPVLWALGGGLGLALGAVVASWISRRIWPGVLAAFLGAIPVLIVVIVGYNSNDLKTGDQVVGSLVVVVLPAFLGAALLATLAALVSRLFGGRPNRRSSVTN